MHLRQTINHISSCSCFKNIERLDWIHFVFKRDRCTKCALCDEKLYKM